MSDPDKLQRLITPSLWAALAGAVAFAVGLAILWQGAGAWLMVAVTATASFPIILLFSFLAVAISTIQVPIKCPSLLRLLILGLLFAGFGFVLANAVAHFDGTFAAFLAAGLSAGIAANKSLNADAGKAGAG